MGDLNVPDHAKPEATRSSRGVVRDVFSNLFAEVIGAGLLALGSMIWFYFGKGPGVPGWVFPFVLLVILAAAYFAFFFIEYLFPADFVLSHRPRLHFTLLALLIFIVTAPMALMQWYAGLQADRLLARNQELTTALQVARTAQTKADGRRLQIYAQVTDSLMTILQKPSLDAADLHDLLHFCVESIALTKGGAGDLRAAVFYVDTSGSYLVIPDSGYYGYALDQDIRHLYFKVTPQAEKERDEQYLERLGVAGWCFVKKTRVRIADIQTPQPGQAYRYKPFEASQKGKADRSMMCVAIPNLRIPGRSIGILALSSPNAGVFTENDLAVAQFFSVLLARFKAPVNTPRLNDPS